MARRHSRLEPLAMSTELWSRVWQRADDWNTQSELLVMLFLADRTNAKTGECYPSRESIARAAKVKTRRLVDILHGLESRGFISMETGNGKGNYTRYQLHLKDAAITAPFEAAERMQPAAPFEGAKGAIYDTQRVQSGALKGAICDTQRVQSASRTKENPSTEPREPYEEANARDNGAAPLASSLMPPNSTGYGPDLDALCDVCLLHYQKCLAADRIKLEKAIHELRVEPFLATPEQIRAFGENWELPTAPRPGQVVSDWWRVLNRKDRKEIDHVTANGKPKFESASERRGREVIEDLDWAAGVIGAAKSR